MNDLQTITIEQKDQLRFSLERRLYQLDFFEFFKAAVIQLEPQTQWVFNWHLEYLCDTAQQLVIDCVNGIPNKDIIINVPPRSTKSYVFSICLNAWAWAAGYAHLKFMTLSYADNLSAKFSYKTRLLIQSNWYQKYFGDEFCLNDDDNRKTAYTNSKSGSRESFGWTGSVTGSGCDVCIIDDCQKPSDISEVKLDNCIDVYRDTVYNRLNNPAHGSVRIIIQQRCNERDLTGYLLSTDADSYEHICLPARLTKDVQPQYLSANYINGLLDIRRFDDLVLAEYSKNLFTFSSQYLQNPLPQEGGLIQRKWFPIIRHADIERRVWEALRWEMYLDTAYTANEKNDETACLIACKYGNNILIKKAYTWYLEYPQLVRRIKEIHQFQMPPQGLIRIEPKANGLSLIQTLKHETTFNVTKSETPKDSKITRITNITSYLEGGRVMLMEDSNIDLMMGQFNSFPNSSKDGLCDCLYYAVNQNINKQTNIRYGIG